MAKDILVSEINKPIVEKTVLDAISMYKDIELVELRYFKEFGKMNMTAFIWKKEGISLDDCENIHNAISAALDTIQDLFDGEYVLNVSSPGLDREIKSNDDLRRSMDTEIEIISTEKKKQHGILVGYSDNDITIKKEKSDKNIIILRNNITKIQPYIRF